MSLSYFTIFNPSLGPDEESLPNQLLFYTSAVVSDLDSQLRSIGLVQGIIELGRSFSPTSGEPVNFIKSKDTRSYLLELEEGFWSILCLDVVSDDGMLSKDIPATNQVLLQIRNAYRLFLLEYGTLQSLLDTGRDEAIRVLESWWMRWSWSWTTNCADAALLMDGYVQARTKLSNTQAQEIADFRARLAEVYPECFSDLLIMHEHEYLDSGSRLSVDLKQSIQLYLAQSHPSKNNGLAAQNGTDTSSTIKPNDSARDESSWLSGKRWTEETTKLFGSLSFGRGTVNEPLISVESPAKYAWRFPEDRRLHFADQEESQPLHKFINVLQAENIQFILILKVPGDRERALVREFVETNVSHLAVSLAPQAIAPHTSSPLFFSLVHDKASGAVTSTLPSIRAAYVPDAEDSPLQTTVKNNTIHLHRQIYQLMGQSATQSCIKTPKNIWILMKRDDTGTSILAKSSKSGETMEEIEREGGRWMTKLRKSYA